MLKSQHIILFDGACNLCSTIVQFIIKRDPNQLFRFASLQSDAGLKLLSKTGSDLDTGNTIVYLMGEKMYVRSDAVLKISKSLTGPWKLFYAFIIVPRIFRDWIYNAVAKNRYYWFGKKHSCLSTSPNLEKRFIH